MSSAPDRAASTDVCPTLAPLPDDRELLRRWHATVTATVEEIAHGCRVCSAEVEREALVSAQMSVATCGRELLAIVARLRAEEVAR